MKRRWIIVVSVGAALLVGTAFGPAVVQAATAGLVRVEGAGSQHVATVNSSGQLSVTDGTHQTNAGQLQVTTASPSQVAFTSFIPTCGAGGNYTVPTGKALIITRLMFYIMPTSTTGKVETDIDEGPAATPCNDIIAAAIDNAPAYGTVPETFDPGIPVPAGYAVGGREFNGAGIVYMYGYLVPAADVPATALTGLPRETSHGLAGVRH
jgi:hypothetical protein